MANSFQNAYLEGRLEPFYQLSAYDLAGAKAQQRKVKRQVLAAALQQYAEKLQAPIQVMRALEQLRQPSSRAVVTGQQTGLLLGPNYSLAKAVTALKLAQEWHSKTEPTVAIFWLASQDHDSQEINHAYLLDMQEVLHRLELPLPEGIPSGRMRLQDSWLEQLITNITEITHQPEYQTNFHAGYSHAVSVLLRDAAAVATSFADFFAAILYRLLGDKGLIILNPLDEAIAPLFADIIRAELANPLGSSRCINQAGAELATLGYTPQLGRGQGASNLFLEHEGKRELLRFEADNYYLDSGANFKLAELEKILQEKPSAITPAAGLRPITQDAILPTLAMVVGPGELRYIAQLRGVYELHNVPMPLLVPRLTVTVLEPPVSRILKKYQAQYGVSLVEILKDIKAVEAQILLQRSGHATEFSQTLKILRKNTQILLEHIQQIDTSLENTVRKSEASIKAKLEHLYTKSAQALARQDSITNQQFQRLQAQLLPLDTAQERLLSPFSFFLKFGIAPTMAALWQLELDSSDWAANDKILAL